MAKTSGGLRQNGGGSSLGKLAKEALDYYISGNGYDMTYNLRIGKALNGEDKLLAKGLDIATKKALGKPYILYRGVSVESLFGKEGLDNFGLLKSHFVNGYNDGYVMDGVKKAMNNKKSTYSDRSFMSTSTDSSTAEGFGGSSSVVLRLKVPSKTKGIDLNSNKSYYKNNTSEKEVLLARNQRYKILKVYGKNGKIYVDAKII